MAQNAESQKSEFIEFDGNKLYFAYEDQSAEVQSRRGASLEPPSAFGAAHRCSFREKPFAANSSEVSHQLVS
jgi:hypothetical protein